MATSGWPTSPSVGIAPTANVIKREKFSRRIDVHANVRGRDLGAVAREVEARLQTVQFPLEYRAECSANTPSASGAAATCSGSRSAVVIGILLLLQASFRSWRAGGTRHS